MMTTFQYLYTLNNQLVMKDRELINNPHLTAVWDHMIELHNKQVYNKDLTLKEKRFWNKWINLTKSHFQSYGEIWASVPNKNIRLHPKKTK